MSLDGNEMMMELFRAEVESHSESLTKSLLQLERDPTDTSVFESMMRAAHSIKGAAKIVRVELAIELAHIIEDCFVAAQHGELSINPADVDVLLNAIDLLVRIAEATRDSNTTWDTLRTDVKKCVAQLRCLREGRPIGDQMPTDSPPTMEKKPSQPAPTASQPPAASQPAASQPIESTTRPVSAVHLTPVLTPSKPKNIKITVGATLYKNDAEQLRKLLIDQLSQEAVTVQIDLSKTQELDPIGLAFLAAAKKHVETKTNAEVHFEPVSENMQLVLRMSGIH